jgi:hypothetical protein
MQAISTKTADNQTLIAQLNANQGVKTTSTSAFEIVGRANE